MTETPQKTTPGWAELSDDVLESVEVGRKAAIEAVRKFVDEVSPMIDVRSVAAQDRHRRRPEFGRGAGHGAHRVPAFWCEVRGRRSARRDAFCPTAPGLPRSGELAVTRPLNSDGFVIPEGAGLRVRTTSPARCRLTDAGLSRR